MLFCHPKLKSLSAIRKFSGIVDLVDYPASL